MLHGVPPSYDHLRVIGWLCFASVTKPLKDKFAPRSIKSVLMGYPPGQKGYRLYDLETYEVFCSKDVASNEDSAPCSVPDITSDHVMPNTASDHDILSTSSDVPCTTSAESTASIPDPMSYPDEYVASLAHVMSTSEPNSYSQAAIDPKWVEAMGKEQQALETNDTWVLTELPDGHKAISSKWVLKTKYFADGTVERYKARLVIRGFDQKEGVDYKHTFSPVAKAATVRVSIAIATIKGWPLHQLDLNNAFLHGFVDEEIYMKPPEGYTKPAQGQICKLNKSLYGLK
ncbi:retrovirus-related pol polyprotein from transposon TNT 1-94 [Tanacetum coccineum]